MKPKKILLLYGYYKNIASTVSDHINAFKKYSINQVTLFPIIVDGKVPFDLAMFDIVMVHYSLAIFYDPMFSEVLQEQLKKYTGLKVIFIQDEYRVVNKVIERLYNMNFNLLFTCVPTNEINKVYSSKKLPNLKCVNTLTGFVPENLLNRKTLPYKERIKDVVYRGRKLSAWYGRLAQEKWQIAIHFPQHSKKYNLNCDVSYREEDRVYGEEWINFLGNSKATLGVESGANVFDFTGEIQQKTEEHEKKYPDTTFEKLEELYFSGLDGQIMMNQISPRSFESAALKTMMILYEGNYSGILEPWRHFVPLKKDYSNLSEVITALKDEQLWSQMTQNTYQEIALNPEYSYKGFIEKFDKIIEQELTELQFIPQKFKSKIVAEALKYKEREIKQYSNDLQLLDNWVKNIRPIYHFILSFFPPSLRLVIKNLVRKILKPFVKIYKIFNKIKLKFVYE